MLIHARSRDRGRPVLEELGGETTLVRGDLAQLDEVHRLADQIHANGPVEHNAGVWVRGNTPRTTADGLETTFAVNVLAPHLLTSLMAAELQGRLLWLGSGSANFGRPDPATLGRPQQPSQAYADSKACDVALALASGRRLLKVASAAVDPGWVKTKLASAGAPGHVTSSADTLAYCCTEADLAAAPYWKDRAPTSASPAERARVGQAAGPDRPVLQPTRSRHYAPAYAGIQAPEGDGEAGCLSLGQNVESGGPLVLLYSDDLDATVKDAGGTIADEPYAFPGGRRFTFFDTSGNRLGVWSTT